MVAPFEPPAILQSPAPGDAPFLARIQPALQKGWAVHAVKPLSKNPLFLLGLQEHAAKDATRDEAHLQAVAAAAPDANYGIPSWPQNPILVVDVDPKNGGRRTFIDISATLPQDVWNTFRVKTPSDGMHFYYQLDADPGIVGGVSKLGAGIDVIHGGLWVVGPGSVRDVDGKRKEYELAKDVTWETPLKPVPAELLALLKGEGSTKAGPFRPAQKVKPGMRYDAVVRLAGQLTHLGWSEEAVMDAVYSQAVATFETKPGEPPVTSDEARALIRKEASRVWRTYGTKATRKAGDIPDERPDPRRLTTLGEHDIGNGQRLTLLYGTRFRFVHEWGYVVWDEGRWRRDTLGRMDEYAKLTVTAMEAAAAGIEDEEKRKAFRAWAKKTSSRDKQASMISLARSEPGVNAFADDFDRHPALLNTADCVVDLASGHRVPQDPDLYLTTRTNIVYDADAACPRWERFLRECCMGDAELVSYLQRAVGYSLTGYTTEHVLFFLFGDGRNGKTTFLEILQDLLGDMAGPIGFETLLTGQNGKAQNALATVAAKRVIVASEPPEGRTFNEGLVKSITGGERIYVEMKYKDGYEISPKFKLWLGANYQPNVRGTDAAIWERIHPIPFQNHVDRSLRNKKLKQELQAELPGILAWAVRGAIEWHRVGLQPPPKVLKAVEEYRDENDIIKRWIEERCTVRVDLATPAGELLKAYNAWAVESHEKELTQTAFGRRITRFRAGLLERAHNGKGLVVYRGLGLGHDLAEPAQRRINDAGAPAPPVVDVHARLETVLQLVRDLAIKAGSGWCHHGDVVTAAAAAGVDAPDVGKALDELKRTNRILARADGRYAPVRT